jgi:hypothetical protein
MAAAARGFCNLRGPVHSLCFDRPSLEEHLLAHEMRVGPWLAAELAP